MSKSDFRGKKPPTPVRLLTWTFGEQLELFDRLQLCPPIATFSPHDLHLEVDRVGGNRPEVPSPSPSDAFPGLSSGRQGGVSGEDVDR